MPLTLYVHVPWCVAKCPYCDFNSHVAPDTLPERAWCEALVRDLDFELARRPAARPLSAIFLGGGTPSLLRPETYAALFAAIARRVDFDRRIEITMEANPGTIERGRFAEYRAAGINRFSLGVQSFDDAMLGRLGRIHGAREALDAVAELHAAGIGNFNLDLMHGLPGQNVAMALADIRRAVALEPAHLSWYELTLEPGTAFYRRPPPLPGEDRLARIETAGRKMIAQAGYRRYEVSAYARPGRVCRHNDNYWSYGDYLGLGPGAHGKRSAGGQVVRTERVRSPARWQRLAGSASGVREHAVAPHDRAFEFMLNALRRMDGFTWDDFEARTGRPRESIAPAVDSALADGLLVARNGGMRASVRGLRYLNELQGRFLPD